mmetsp:Transcript_18873/g.47876  ORF Transcript_18873/g.47876 Transcript_18873/m.47876 type:complete len:327 (-) Transcript_18873:5192-6172(-)
MRGHCGQGLPAARPAGGLSSSSRLTMDVAPWRSEVPMQSVPVSPPPITTTFLPAALMNLPSASLESNSDLVLACRNSMAKCTPASERPSTGRSRGLVAPAASSSASWPDTSCVTGTFLPTCAFTTNWTPSAAMRSTRRCTTSVLSVFMLGTPYIMRPPMRSARSNTVTSWPILFSWSAAARPAGPEPTTATLRPVRTLGGRGVIQPSSNALSMMDASTLLMDTGFSMMPSTHAPSHGAGHTRPVNSGKLLVSSRRSSASRQRPLCTRSLNSGILLPSGQPLMAWWQKGVPHSMQRAACVCSRSPRASGATAACTSFQSLMRSNSGR